MRFVQLVFLGGIASVFSSLTEQGAADELSAAFHAINAPDIRVHIDVLADDSFEGREAGSRGGHAAGGYLVQHLERYGLKPAGERGSYFQEFRGSCRNVLAVLEGSDAELSNEYVLIGAHYDHVGYGNRKNSFGPFGYVHNGADDNASGVAGVLEIVEGFLAMARPPRRSILFAFWDGEEQGLWGSKHWTAAPTVPLNRVVFALNADMIGHLRDNRVMVYGTRTSAGLRKLASECNTMTDLVLDFTWELKGNSDHHSFVVREIPVLMLHTGLHDDYHRPSDDAHRINHDGSQQVARLLFAIAHELANTSDAREFRRQARSEKPEDLVELERPAPPRPPRLGVTLGHRESETPGVYLKHVFPGLPADRAGLKQGDVLLSFAGHEVVDVQQLLVDVLGAESPAAFVVRRENEGATETIEIPVLLEGNPLRLGISWREDGAEPGAVVLTEVVPNSAAHLGGLQVADRIYQAAGRDFADGNELLRVVGSWTGPLDLLIERQGRLQTITLELPAPQL